MPLRDNRASSRSQKLHIYQEEQTQEQAQEHATTDTNSCASDSPHLDSVPLTHMTPAPKEPDRAVRSPCFDLRGNGIFFISLGCPRNLVDSEVMLGILLKNGYQVVDSLETADYIVINTCGFLEASRQESRDSIQQALSQRKQNARVVVTGCMVQTHQEELKKHFSQIDYLLGSGDLEGILEAVRSDEQGSLVSSARSYLEAGEVPRRLSTPRHYAYLKIAEGCRKRCAYCVIPTIKGPLKSKPQERVIKEVNSLLAQGVQEIILIAQDLGDYGKDFAEKHPNALTDLLREILSIQQPFWLRLLYLYPDEITPELIALMRSDNRICPYLDIPIQHINNDVLRAMRRNTSKEAVCSLISRLRSEIPGIAIRTSLIVGFPGETDAQFEELLDFVRSYPLDQIGVFKFSREPGSHAYSLPNQIPESVKEKRYNALMQVQQKVVAKQLRKLIGKRFEVFVEGYHPESRLLLVGRYYGQCPEIDGVVIINEGIERVSSFGERYLVQITDVAGYDLVGKVLLKKP